MLTTNDALGGAGSVGGAPGSSFKEALQAIAVGGISRLVDGALSKKYPLTSFNEGDAVNARGEITPAGAPAAEGTATEGFLSALRNPYVIGVGVALIAALALFAALRR